MQKYYMVIKGGFFNYSFTFWLVIQIQIDMPFSKVDYNKVHYIQGKCWHFVVWIQNGLTHKWLLFFGGGGVVFLFLLVSENTRKKSLPPCFTVTHTRDLAEFKLAKLRNDFETIKPHNLNDSQQKNHWPSRIWTWDLGITSAHTSAHTSKVVFHHSLACVFPFLLGSCKFLVNKFSIFVLSDNYQYFKDVNLEFQLIWQTTFGWTKQFCQLQLPISYCVSLKAYSLMPNRGRSQNCQNLYFLHIFIAPL